MKQIKIFLNTALLACGLCSIHCVHADAVDASIAALNSAFSRTTCEQRPNAEKSEQWTSEKGGKGYLEGTYCEDSAWYGSTIKRCDKLSCAERASQALCKKQEGFKCEDIPGGGSTLTEDCVAFCAASSCEESSRIAGDNQHPCQKSCDSCKENQGCFSPLFSKPTVCTDCNDISCTERKQIKECVYDEETSFCEDFYDPQIKKSQSQLLNSSCHETDRRERCSKNKPKEFVFGDKRYCCNK